MIYNVSEIFGEWGVPRVQNSYSELKAVRTGAEYSLAELMELELQGRLVNRMGARFLVGGGV